MQDNACISLRVNKLKTCFTMIYADIRHSAGYISLIPTDPIQLQIMICTNVYLTLTGFI